jgi:hypothetical protein
MCTNDAALLATHFDVAFQLIILAIAVFATAAGMVITALWVYQQQEFIETVRDQAEQLAHRAWQIYMPNMPAEPREGDGN